MSVFRLNNRLNAWRERARRLMQRVPGPERQPIVLPQRRVYVMPTAAGLGVVVMLVVMLLAAINYNLSLGYAFTFLIAGSGVAHILATWHNLVGLRIHLRPGEPCFAGEMAEFRVQLDCPREQRRYALQIFDAAGSERLAIDHSGTLAWPMALPAQRRGWLRAGRLRIETRYPLGWVRAWSYIEPDAQLLVYPQPAGDLPLPSGGASGQQDARQPLALAEEEFAGLREHRPGDPPGRIAWRRTARDGTLLVKHFTPLDYAELALSWQQLPAALDVEARLSQLCQWLLQAQTAQLRVSLQLPGVQLDAAQDASHYLLCLQALALFAHAEAQHD